MHRPTSGPNGIRSLRSVVEVASSVALLVAACLLAFGYKGPHMDRMVIVTSVTATLAGLIAACLLLARGRSRAAKWGLRLLAVPLTMLLALTLLLPINVPQVRTSNPEEAEMDLEPKWHLYPPLGPGLEGD